MASTIQTNSIGSFGIGQPVDIMLRRRVASSSSQYVRNIRQGRPTCYFVSNRQSVSLRSRYPCTADAAACTPVPANDAEGDVIGPQLSGGGFGRIVIVAWSLASKYMMDKRCSELNCKPATRRGGKKQELL